MPTAAPVPAPGARVAVDSLRPRSRRWRALIVVLAILAPQCALFAPSVVGAKILLPLDVLTVRSNWIGQGEPEHRDEAQEWYLSDLTFVIELNRRYAAREVRAGRLPLWWPYGYCGAPFLAANQPAVFSPFRLVDYLWPGPEAIAWAQLIKSLVAGLGMYLFLRRAVGSSFLAATLGASAFPLSGYMILWAGCPLSNVAAWLPWMLWATHESVRKPRSLAPIGLGCVGAAALVAGHSANAGHLFLASGVYALWRIADTHGWRPSAFRAGAPALLAVVFGWLAGFALSAPQLLPTLEYMGQSMRIAMRESGFVESQPEGFLALFQVALPYSLGSGEKGAAALVDLNRFEGGPSAYAGLIGLLLLAPLAFADRERRAQAVFFAVVGAVALIPLLGVPYLESIFKLPPLLYLRNNRLTLVTAFSIVVLSTIGLDALVRGHVKLRRWHWVLIALISVLALLLAKRIIAPSSDLPPGSLDWFRRYDSQGLAIACAAVGLWFGVRSGAGPRVRMACILAGALVLELTLNAWGVNPQCERELYYPRLKVLAEIEKRGPGRMLGVNCIMPNLAQVHGLCDVRGYDAADPVRISEVMLVSRDERLGALVPYAVTMDYVPNYPSGIANMLALRWIVLQGAPPNNEEVAFTGGGYSLMENKNALPRAYVPARVEVVPDRDRRLALLASREFDPRAVAYVERDLEMRLTQPTVGSASIVKDEPSQVALELEMKTPGLVVLADSWDAGWKAEVDGVETPVFVTNHALRGVCVSAGPHRLEFRYEPRSFAIGLWIAAAALVSMGAWALFARRRPTYP